MTGRQIAYSIPIVLACLACATVTVLVWRRRRASPAVRHYAWATLAQAVWCLGYFCELLSPTLAGKVFWDAIQVAPGHVIAIETLAFTLTFTGRRALTAAPAWKALWLLPLVHVGAALTWRWNGFEYAGAHVVPGDPLDALVYPFTLLDTVGYLYALSFAPMSFGVLASHYLGQKSAFRVQGLSLLTGLLLPLVSAAVLLGGATVLGQRDTMPYAFALGSLLVGWALLRGGLFDLVPIAHEVTIAASPDAVVVTDVAGRIVHFNAAFGHLAGVPEDDLLGRTAAEMAPWLGSVLARKSPTSDIEVTPDCVLEPRVVEVADSSGQCLGYVLSLHDVTSRHRVEKALHASHEQLERGVKERTAELVAANEALRREILGRKLAEVTARETDRRLRGVLDQTFQLIGLVALDGTLLDANRAALDSIGARAEDVIGKPFWDTPWWSHSAELREQLKDAMRAASAGRLARFSATHRTPSGELRHVDFSIKPLLDETGVPVLLIPEGRDVTDLRKADEEKRALSAQLTQAQKMDSLGRLAGGIAHDFNNLLTAILGNVELARMTQSPAGDMALYLDDIAHAGESAKALVQQLLVFGRKQKAERLVVDLREAVRGAVQLLGRVLGANIEIVVALPAEPARTMVDPIQLEQIIVNLAVNARDAMPNGGKLRFSLDFAEPAGAVSASRRVRLRVADDGVGMSEDVREHIFEPFFTTKAVGHGTGLGLSLVFAAVQQNDGTIAVDSAPGVGTTFTIEFPEAIEDGPTQDFAEPAQLPTGRETIFLVEDQVEISRFACRLLTRLGYTVRAFSSAEELLVTAPCAEGADILLSDVVLPGVSGPDLAARLVRAKPSLRVLLISGYHDEALRERGGDAGAFRILQKPFSIDQLATAIRSVVDAKGVVRM
jgi:two-component system, cell cycle sensor histidine kinase and response regulator CckA